MRPDYVVHGRPVAQDVMVVANTVEQAATRKLYWYLNGRWSLQRSAELAALGARPCSEHDELIARDAFMQGFRAGPLLTAFLDFLNDSEQEPA